MAGIYHKLFKPNKIKFIFYVNFRYFIRFSSSMAFSKTTRSKLKNIRWSFESACIRIWMEVCSNIIDTFIIWRETFLDPVVSMFYVPDGEGMYTRGSSSQAIFLMGQSIFIIAQLLTAGLLHVNELDPIRRYLPSYNRPRKGGSRYSAFQVKISKFIWKFHFILTQNQNSEKFEQICFHT